MKKPLSEQPKLCYIDGCWAWFTTAPLTGEHRQWGDDWDDAPYEHNAETPYEWDHRSGSPRYVLYVMAFKSRLVTPSGDVLNSTFSVEDINSGAVAWLRKSRYDSGDAAPPIMAGTPWRTFIEMIEAAGGQVYRLEKDI